MKIIHRHLPWWRFPPGPSPGGTWKALLESQTAGHHMGFLPRRVPPCAVPRGSRAVGVVLGTHESSTPFAVMVCQVVVEVKRILTLPFRQVSGRQYPVSARPGAALSRPVGLWRGSGRPIHGLAAVAIVRRPWRGWLRQARTPVATMDSTRCGSAGASPSRQPVARRKRNRGTGPGPSCAEGTSCLHVASPSLSPSLSLSVHPRFHIPPLSPSLSLTQACLRGLAAALGHDGPSAVSIANPSIEVLLVLARGSV
jgi:hypothetical protein